MANKILVLTGRYHFGDNAGVFQDAAYIGHILSLPLRKTWINPNTQKVELIFTTHDVETWGTWQGHKVSVNRQEVGRLKDPNNTYGREEEFVIGIPKPDFDAILSGNDNFTLEIELEKQPAAPGLSDDFVLTRLETEEIAVTTGWK